MGVYVTSDGRLATRNCGHGTDEVAFDDLEVTAP